GWRGVEGRRSGGNGGLRLASRATDTGIDDEFETYADVTGGGAAERVSVKMRWRHDLAGRADATFTEGDLGTATVVATECWTQQGDALAVVYYADSAGLRPTTGTESACVVTQVTPRPSNSSWSPSSPTTATSPAGAVTRARCPTRRPSPWRAISRPRSTGGRRRARPWPRSRGSRSPATAAAPAAA